MINLRIDKKALDCNIARARERGVAIPTFKQMKNPGSIPESVQEKLRSVGLWDINPLNLFRITWKNEPTEHGGLFGDPNFIELPKAITGVDAHIVAMVGKWFPTGCHKVGASFGCLVPRLATGQFDASKQKAVWPSTGNYCRGGAFNSRLLGVYSIAILPQGMSKERFEWLEKVASEIIATPGTESNVKEIFDKTWELRKNRDDVMIFNQFEEMGNHLWHYEVTGNAICEAFEKIRGENGRLAAACFTSGSAGTIGSGDFIKEKHPAAKIAAGEALSCPTLLMNGFGEHEIEGIGDKHVPWIHNVRNTDLVIGIDGFDCLSLLRLFNTPKGREYLSGEAGVPQETIDSLSLLGISGIANALCAIKTAKYYELDSNDYVFTVLTDSASMYLSRINELDEAEGEYTLLKAAFDFGKRIQGARTDFMEELTYRSRKRIHNLKYYTWVEQQGRSAQELDSLWYDYEGSWGAVHRQAEEIDRLIEDFNDKTGLARL
ncbi:MAG: pyridoxal-5-phosphate-dependent protein subunit beta [Clostridiales bacterium]|nr:pyridoxal-5-phosphate-dependent protein subunit beta [Clostridiales bacterium]